MIINFQHNTLVRETVTEGFLRYVNESLVPKLTEKYGQSVTEALFYENTLNLDLSRDGKRYYPLTLLFGNEPRRQWVSWAFPKANAFLDENPFAYIANTPLEFFLEDTVPEELEALVARIPLSYSRESLPITVELTTGSVALLVGRYSQSFLDEMARQLTVRIEESQKVCGVAKSNIRLTMTFAPMTFMEHNCEGVTYRRLLISEEGGRAEKDFWVSWHRASSDAPVSIAEDIAPGEVIFLIGEDVPQKVREKEFRYLTRQNAEKYRSAMGRKTVTEWHELLKRAMKRGELARMEAPEISTPTVSAVAPALPVAEEAPAAPIMENIIEEASTPEVSAPELDEENDPLLALLRQIAETQAEESAENTDEPAAEESAPEEYLDAMSLLRDFVDRDSASTPDAEAPDETPAPAVAPEALVETVAPDTQTEPETEAVPEIEAEPEVEAPAIVDDEPLFGYAPIQETFSMPELEEPTRFDEPLIIEEIVPLTLSAALRGEHHAQEEMSLESLNMLSLPEMPIEEITETPSPLGEETQEGEEDSPLCREKEAPVPTVATPEEAPVIEPEKGSAAPSGIYTSEAVLIRRIRESILEEIEMRERERLAEEARRAVVERQEREVEMQRIARERAEAEAYRREMATLREQLSALADEVRSYTALCRDAMLAFDTQSAAAQLAESEQAPEEEILPTEQARIEEILPTEEEPQIEEATETVESSPAEEAPTTERSYTESELQALLAEQQQRLMAEMEARFAQMMAQKAEAEPVVCEEASAPAEEFVTVEPTSEADAPKEEAPQEEDTVAASVIEELLFDDAREAEERERIAEIKKLIDERQEKLEALRREEEERRERVAELTRKQEELEEIARAERERQEEENRRLEQERREAEELALKNYESHLREARRLEEELQEAQRRREEEDARIREAEERIEEQRRLAEQAREEQIRKNEQTRRLTAEAEERLSEIYRATELGREIAERTEEESRIATETIAQEAERIREQTLRHEQEERQRAEAERLVLERGESAYVASPTDYTFVRRLVHLTFDRAIDPNLISQIQRLMGETIAYFNKSAVPISVRAEITGQMTLDLDFFRIPKEEEPLLINIVKVLGRSKLGIRRASIDD